MRLNEIQFCSKISRDSWQKRKSSFQEAAFFLIIKFEIILDTAVTSHCYDIIACREKAYYRCILGSHGILRQHRRTIKCITVITVVKDTHTTTHKTLILVLRKQIQTD